MAIDKKEPPLVKGGGGVPPKMAAFYSRLFGILKFILGILLLPFVYSFTVSFIIECAKLTKTVNTYFCSGIISFLLVYLFVYEPLNLYNKGQKILEAVFRFFTPLVKVAPYLLPIYSIILFAGYFLYALFDKSPAAVNWFVFFFGFTVALHLVFSAKSLRARQNDFLKANYIFGFSFIYILNIALLAAVFSLMFSPYSFVDFCNHGFQAAKGIFFAVFRQLFVPKS